MTKIIDILTAVKTFGDIAEDNEMFTLGQGSELNISKLGLYTLLGQGNKVFKNALLNSDSVTSKYTIFSAPKDVKDPIKIKEKEKEFSKAKKEMEKIVAQWRDDNQDMFIISKGLPNISRYCSKEINEGFVDTVIDPDIAYFLFRTYDNALKDFLEVNKDKLMTAERRIIAPDHSKDYKSFQEEVRKSLGVPTTAEIKDMVEGIVTVRGQSLRRNKIDHTKIDPLKELEAMNSAEEYTNQLVGNFKLAETE